MSITDNKVISIHKSRRKARQRERELQRLLNLRYETPDHASANAALSIARVPRWAQGVRVDHAGLLQYVVVATVSRGR